ncbi:hypothetical protein ACHAP5_012160 [Fusarium lateritium]
MTKTFRHRGFLSEGGFGRPEGAEDAGGYGNLAPVGNELAIDLVDEIGTFGYLLFELLGERLPIRDWKS